jgi:hypothetical protein
VYLNGGPNRAHGNNVLADGTYYFAVLAPGHQNGGAADGAIGNLSDTVAHGGTDTGGGDSITLRTFVMSGGVLSYPAAGSPGAHPMGTSPNGQPILGVAPFDVTPNPGGVYILAVCPVGSSSASDCKFDAFKTERCGTPPCQPSCAPCDKNCVVCPPTCQPECPSGAWGETDAGCVPCECDPSCDPWSCSDCTPCL